MAILTIPILAIDSQKKSYFLQFVWNIFFQCIAVCFHCIQCILCIKNKVVPNPIPHSSLTPFPPYSPHTRHPFLPLLSPYPPSPYHASPYPIHLTHHIHHTHHTHHIYPTQHTPPHTPCRPFLSQTPYSQLALSTKTMFLYFMVWTT